MCNVYLQKNRVVNGVLFGLGVQWRYRSAPFSPWGLPWVLPGFVPRITCSTARGIAVSTETLRIAASLPWPAAPAWRDRRTLAWVLLLCIGQVALWGQGIGLNYQSPDIDSAEQFVWAFSMENGYWKHPPRRVAR